MRCEPRERGPFAALTVGVAALHLLVSRALDGAERRGAPVTRLREPLACVRRRVDGENVTAKDLTRVINKTYAETERLDFFDANEHIAYWGASAVASLHGSRPSASQAERP